MKNLISIFLGITMLFSAVLLPSGKVYAQYNTVQNTAALESQLNGLQKELIVLLNKKIVLLRAELVSMWQAQLRSIQIQLIGLLQKKVAILQAQLDARNR